MARIRLAPLVPLALVLGVACSSGDGPDDPAPGAAPASGSVGGAATETTVRDGATTTTTASSGGGATPTSETTAPGARPTSTTTPAGPGIALAGDGGRGTFAYDLVRERGELCYRLEVDPAPTAARVVRAAGGTVVELAGAGSRCVASDLVTLEEIAAAPAEFAVEVVTSRGTLRAALR